MAEEEMEDALNEWDDDEIEIIWERMIDGDEGVNAALVQQVNGRQDEPNNGNERNQVRVRIRDIIAIRGRENRLLIDERMDLYRERANYARRLADREAIIRLMEENRIMEDGRIGEREERIRLMLERRDAFDRRHGVVRREERIAELDRLIAMNNDRIGDMQRRMNEGEVMEELNRDDPDLVLVRQNELDRERFDLWRQERREFLFGHFGLAEDLEFVEEMEEDERRQRERREEVTEEMIREAQMMREEDEKSNPSSIQYSRQCMVCSTQNPSQRAVYINCGHIVCYSCAVDKARDSPANDLCASCQLKSGFVKLFEEECEEEKKNYIIDENQSNIVNGVDEKRDPASLFSRQCFICAILNPRQRAVFTHCGHIICYPCAVDNERSDATNGNCVFCRSANGFIKLFEKECEIEKKE